MLNHATDLQRSWETDPRWEGITRPYSAEDVDRLRGTIRIEHSLARMGAERLWHLLHTEPYVHALGALTGNQAVQQVQAGLKAIYLSGWQVAGDANLGGQMYPDQSLYPANSVPAVVRAINNALQRADQIHRAEGETRQHWFAPIVADAEAGFGGQRIYGPAIWNSRSVSLACPISSGRSSRSSIWSQNAWTKSRACWVSPTVP